MRHLIIILAILVAACDNKESALTVSARDVTIDAAGNGQRVIVTTNEPIWEAVSEDDWPVIERDSLGVVISAASNPTREPRSARLYIAAGSRFERINIAQDGSLRVIGDPYPDAVNPIGVVYKVSEGGQHGKIVSIDQLAAAPWSVITETHESSFVDGKAATRAVINARAASPAFAADYPAFAWVHQKNNGNPNGDWYIPSFWELVEMYNILVGNFAYVIPGGAPPSMQMNLTRPAHNLTLRDAFNETITLLGGAPFDYAASMYWSSSEASEAQASAVSFNNGTDYMHTSINYNKATNLFFVRATLDF